MFVLISSKPPIKKANKILNQIIKVLIVALNNDAYHLAAAPRPL